MKTYFQILFILCFFAFVYWRIHTNTSNSLSPKQLGQIHQAMQNYSLALQDENEELLAKMHTLLDDDLLRGDRSTIEMRDSFELIHRKTEDILQYITGIDDSYNKIQDDAKIGKINASSSSFFLGGTGKAALLHDSLTQYYNWMENIYNKNRPDSVKWHKVRFFEEENNTTWEQENFAGGYTENRISLERWKQKVTNLEFRLLNYYAQFRMRRRFNLRYCYYDDHEIRTPYQMRK